ncbi:RING-H2 zinc finger protein RHA4a-like protein isoform X1 [Cinnamomum micranthum f. kanehirae]|uniref:RING-type E3 ubiquitin transferase n=1 Tax=Cinnamomum micranthum f. kanehirae TaxID=337451 RepID=A0A443Q0C3_9MAGN|nr:RING-H2 zinc finger protein RHA4a-like protein isoform X1 [Cinnamomum micranthum f. kanehirae]
MGQLPQTTSSHPYPLSLQLKLYQAFIFSVPILFTIILFLLFYLFYLKRRGSSTPHMHARSLNRATITTTVLSLPFEMGMKNDLKEILPIVTFDEDLRERDTQCCVCLGDFEIKEQLHQIPSCKHMFHLECIHHWLMSNTTCPLCRASILPTKMEPPIRLNMVRPSDAESSDIPQQGPQDQVMVIVVENINEERSSSIEGSIGCPCSTESGNSQARDTPNDASVGVQIQIHEG